jgi:hypothetical protein
MNINQTNSNLLTTAQNSIILTESNNSNANICLFNALPDDVKNIIFKLAGIESWRTLAQIDKTNRSFILDNPKYKEDLLIYKFVKKCESKLPEDQEAKNRIKFDLIELLSSLNPVEVKIEELNTDITPQEKLLSIVEKLATGDLKKAEALTKTIKDSDIRCKALVKIAKSFEKTNFQAALTYYKSVFDVIIAREHIYVEAQHILLDISQSVFKKDFAFCLKILKEVEEGESIFHCKDKIVKEISKNLEQENLDALLQVINLMPNQIKTKCLITLAKNLIPSDKRKAEELHDKAIEILRTMDKYYTEFQEIAFDIKEFNPQKATELLNQALLNTKNLIKKEILANNLFTQMSIHQIQYFESVIYITLLAIDNKNGVHLLLNIEDKIERERACYQCAFAFALDNPSLALELISYVDTKHFDVHSKVVNNLPISEISTMISIIESIQDPKYKYMALDYVLERVKGKKLLLFLDIVYASEDPFEKITFLAAFSKAVHAFDPQKAAELANEALKLAAEYEGEQEFELYAFLAQKLIKIDLVKSLELGVKCTELLAAEPMTNGVKLNELYFLFNELLAVDTVSALSFMYEIITNLKPTDHDYFEVLGKETALINPKIAFNLIMRTNSTYGRCVGLTNLANTVLKNPNNENFKKFWI